MQPFTHWNSLLASIVHIGEQFQVGLMNAQVQPDRMWSKRWGGKQNDRQVKLQVDNGIHSRSTIQDSILLTTFGLRHRLVATSSVS